MLILLTLICLILTACADGNIPGLNPASLTLIAQTAEADKADEADTVAQAATSTPVATDTPVPSPTPTDPPTATSTSIPPTNTPIPPTNTPIPPTNTPAPTDTPVPPTATATVTATPESVVTIPQVSANDTNVNLRSGPSTDYDRVGVLAVGESLEIVGRNADSSWWQVSTPSGVAWVAASVTAATNVDGTISVVDVSPPASAAAPSNSTTASSASSLERFNQGLEYFNAENWPAALVEFEAVTRADPGFAAAHKYLGLSNFVSDNYDAARVALETYLRLDPNADDKDDVQTLLERIDLGPNVAITPLGQRVTIPEGQGLVIVVNYTADIVIVDILDQSYELPGKNLQPDGGEVAVPLWPGHYTITAHNMDGRAAGSAEFDIAAGQWLNWPLYIRP